MSYLLFIFAAITGFTDKGVKNWQDVKQRVLGGHGVNPRTGKPRRGSASPEERPEAYAVTSAAVSSVDATFTVTLAGIEWEAGYDEGLDASTAIKNRFQFDIDAGGLVYIVKNLNDGTWSCIQALCPS